jgi:hypothetical protein
MQMKALSQRLPMIDLMNKSRNASDFDEMTKEAGRKIEDAL